jgi:hypothetical protein
MANPTLDATVASLIEYRICGSNRELTAALINDLVTLISTIQNRRPSRHRRAVFLKDIDKDQYREGRFTTDTALEKRGLTARQ